MMDVDSDTKIPAPSATLPDAAHVGTVDGWIETLMQCKQLSEADVQRLCEKVSLAHPRHRHHDMLCTIATPAAVTACTLMLR